MLVLSLVVGCGKSEQAEKQSNETGQNEEADEQPRGETVQAAQPPPAESSHTKPEETPAQSQSTVFRAIGKATTFHALNDNGEIEAIGLEGDHATDALLVHLKGLPKLKELWLNRAKITDAGLVHLKELTNLKILHLKNTQISDAGLVHLKGLTKLERLDLRDSQITDAGVVHLKGLTNLEMLLLSSSIINDGGVGELTKALPNCKISP